MLKVILLDKKLEVEFDELISISQVVVFGASSFEVGLDLRHYLKIAAILILKLKELLLKILIDEVADAN